MNSFTCVGRSSGRPPVGRGEPGDALPSGGDQGLCADMHTVDNRERRVRRRPTANLGGGA